MEFNLFSICVIAPSWHHLADPFLHQPYWELYYATILREHHFKKEVSVEVIDLRGNGQLKTKIESISEYDLYSSLI